MSTALQLPDAGGITWSVRLAGPAGAPLGGEGADTSLRTASVGKVLLLLEAARAITEGSANPDELLTRSLDEWVADSGLWHTLSAESLPLADVAALVGAVSDNLATNVLLRRVGLDQVARLATVLGLRSTALHDRVRHERGDAHAATLSTGSAAELHDLVARICAGAAVSPAADALVRGWLSGNVDQSMVGSVFVEQAGLDPIAHHLTLTEAVDQAGSQASPEAPTTTGLGRGDPASAPLKLWNKTGTDRGVRADVGAVSAGERTVTWAAIANWEPYDRTPPSASARTRDDLITWAVLRGMRQVGELALEALTA